MSTTEENGLTSGDVLIDGLLQCLHQSGRTDRENMQALARLVVWCSLSNLADETPSMFTARDMMRNGALMFDREISLAQIAGSEGDLD